MEAATVVGHSLGAVLAQALALAAPQRVQRLVLVSGGMVVEKQPLNLQSLLFLVPGIGEWLYNRLRRNPDKAYETLAPYYASLRSLPRAERLFLYQRVNERVWDGRQRRAYLSTLRRVMPWVARQQRRLQQDLQGLATPTAIVWGDADQIFPVENGQALAALLPAASLTVVPGGGHQLPQERPEAILETIRAAQQTGATV
jgi:pimeloyl-ACP methyl ester carboxylesterase